MVILVLVDCFPTFNYGDFEILMIVFYKIKHNSMKIYNPAILINAVSENNKYMFPFRSIESKKLLKVYFVLFKV